VTPSASKATKLERVLDGNDAMRLLLPIDEPSMQKPLDRRRLGDKAAALLPRRRVL
jgi:hypothetical protein